MPVSFVQYRGAVGNFHNRKFFNTNVVNKVFGHRYWMPTNFGTVLLLLLITLCAVLHKSSKTSKNISVGILLFNILLKLPFLSILIMLCGEVEINPGPKTISQQGHWNLNSIIAHNFAKIFLLKAYVVSHKFDVININYLNQCIVFDIKLGDEICSFVVLYRSPSQSSDEFEFFSKNLELSIV